MALLDNFKASMKMELPKTAYSPGEKISGVVFLEVKSPVNANGAKVSLICCKQVQSGKRRRAIGRLFG